MLAKVFDEIIADLPWLDHTRLAVGPKAPREAVKDELLARAPAIPGWAAGSLAELARGIVSERAGSNGAMSHASQCDALQAIARTEWLKQRAPALCGFLRARPVAAKVARFLTQLDRFYAHEGELDAMAEYCAARDAAMGEFVRVVRELWARGQLSPWGEGALLRRALAALEAGKARDTLPKTLWLWAYSDFTPLEEAFLESLSGAGVALKYLVPEGALGGLEDSCRAVGLEPVPLEAACGALRFWEPHSVWDELEFLRDEFARLRTQGARWDEVAIFVPEDELYKRVVRLKLREWNVPLLDPTLSGAWKDSARWVWWRDYLRAIASGLELGEVKSWIGPGPGRMELFEDAFSRAVHGGASRWSRLAERHAIPELKALVAGAAALSNAMSPAALQTALERLVPVLEELLGPDRDAELLLDFARHLNAERPFLEDFRARLPRYVPLFEEYLESRSRSQSLRAAAGVRFVAHGVWLPRPARHAFVLGAGRLTTRVRPSADPWAWEAVEVRKIWERIHFSAAWAERVRLEEEFLAHAVQAHGSVVLSAPAHDVSGDPLAPGALYERLKGTATPEKTGGHLAVGWTAAGAASEGESQAVPGVKRPDLVAEGPMRVSAFEDYLRCPFIYYARHVLGIEPERELGLDPDGRARGTVLHRVLERILREEIESGTRLALEPGLRRLKELVDEELRGAVSGMYPHEPLKHRARAELLALVERWLRWELENRERHPEVRPLLVEEPVEIELSPGFTLKGKADRVDSDGKHAVIVDYKSGGAPMIGRELREGIGAQLLMYAHGVERTRGLEPAAAYYLTLGRAVSNTAGVFMKKHQKKLHSADARNSGLADGEFGTLFERVSENWRRAAQDLSKGEFAPRPARGKKECDGCIYRELCGGAVEH